MEEFFSSFVYFLFRPSPPFSVSTQKGKDLGPGVILIELSAAWCALSAHEMDSLAFVFYFFLILFFTPTSSPIEDSCVKIK
jgi:hypothetical protein